ncbi:acid protease [Hypoxylon sp. FL0543]|nr:acid protease [Hypoxylon sp. FL0543]
MYKSLFATLDAAVQYEKVFALLCFPTSFCHDSFKCCEMHSLSASRPLIISAVLRLIGIQGAFAFERRQSVLNLGSRDGPPLSTRLRWLDDVNAYTTQVRVGTPGQNITMRVEFENFYTYSTVIPSTNASGCVNATDFSGLCPFGSFNQNTSSTFQVDRVWRYNGSLTGLLFTDTIELGGLILDNSSMILAYKTTPESIEYWPYGKTTAVNNAEPSLPIFYLLGDAYSYPDNPFSRMTTYGEIVTPAFSLWFEDEGDYEGELLFGAIDAQRYDGDLVSLQTYSAQGTPLSPGEGGGQGVIAIAMTSLSASSSTGTDNIWMQGPLLVHVKLGDDLWLSPSLAAQIRDITGAFVRLDETGTYEYTVIPCSMRDSEGYFTFGFGGPEAFNVNVTMRSLVSPPSTKLRELFNSFGDDMCRFGISEVKGEDTGFLSSHLLRSVYSVYDLYNNKVAMATPKRNVKDGYSNIVTFGSLAAPIPSATIAPSQPSTASTIAWSGPSQAPSFRAAEGFKILTVTTSPPSSLPTSLPSSLPTSLLPIPDSTPERLSKTASVGIGVGVSVGTILLVIGAALIWQRRKKRSGLVTRSLIQQQLRSEKPELQEVSIDVVQVKPPFEIHGNLLPAELSGIREPSELCGVGRRAELSGPPVPDKDRN